MSTEIKDSPAKISGADAVRIALDEAMAADPSVVVFGEDVADPEGGGVMGATEGLSTKYGSRVRSTPISEQAIIGAAIGAAIAGMRPVAEIMMMNFMAVAMDQIVNHAAKIRYMSGGQTGVPLTIRTMSGGGASLGGQHSDMMEAWFAHVPGLKVVVPSNVADWKGLLTSCIFDDNPCIIVEPTLMMRAKTGIAPSAGHRVPLGKASVARIGTDVSVIGYGRPINDVLVVAEKLSTEGISVEVIDLRTIAPYDKQTVLGSVAKTRRAVIVHEAVRSFGVGAEIAAHINEELFGQLYSPVRRVASKDTPVPFSSALEPLFLWSQDSIENSIRQSLQ